MRRPETLGDSGEMKVALSREHEEHKKLLAESHRLVMDLRRQAQQGERNWNREKGELLDRFERERYEWQKQRKEFLRTIEQVYS